MRGEGGQGMRRQGNMRTGDSNRGRWGLEMKERGGGVCNIDEGE
jgi:hypothetical protein